MFKVQYFLCDEWHDLIGYPKMTLKQATDCWLEYMESYGNDMNYRIERVD